METDAPNSTRETEGQLPSPTTSKTSTTPSANEELTRGAPPTKPASSPALQPKAQPNSTKDLANSRASWVRQWAGLITIAAAALLAIVLSYLIYPLCDPNRSYVALSAAAGSLVVGGLVVLIVLIPAAASKSDVRTELYSVRAAYLCVVAGLILLVIVAIGVVFAQVMQTVGRH